MVNLPYFSPKELIKINKDPLIAVLKPIAVILIKQAPFYVTIATIQK